MSSHATLAIEASGLEKSFGKSRGPIAVGMSLLAGASVLAVASH